MATIAMVIDEHAQCGNSIKYEVLFVPYTASGIYGEKCFKSESHIDNLIYTHIIYKLY